MRRRDESEPDGERCANRGVGAGGGARTSRGPFLALALTSATPEATRQRSTADGLAALTHAAEHVAVSRPVGDVRVKAHGASSSAWAVSTHTVPMTNGEARAPSASASAPLPPPSACELSVASSPSGWRSSSTQLPTSPTAAVTTAASTAGTAAGRRHAALHCALRPSRLTVYLWSPPVSSDARCGAYATTWHTSPTLSPADEDRPSPPVGSEGKPSTGRINSTHAPTRATPAASSAASALVSRRHSAGRVARVVLAPFFETVMTTWWPLAAERLQTWPTSPTRTAAPVGPPHRRTHPSARAGGEVCTTTQSSCRAEGEQVRRRTSLAACAGPAQTTRAL